MLFLSVFHPCSSVAHSFLFVPIHSLLIELQHLAVTPIAEVRQRLQVDIVINEANRTVGQRHIETTRMSRPPSPIGPGGSVRTPAGAIGTAYLVLNGVGGKTQGVGCPAIANIVPGEADGIAFVVTPSRIGIAVKGGLVVRFFARQNGVGETV